MCLSQGLYKVLVDLYCLGIALIRCSFFVRTLISGACVIETAHDIWLINTTKSKHYALKKKVHPQE